MFSIRNFIIVLLFLSAGICIGYVVGLMVANHNFSAYWENLDEQQKKELALTSSPQYKPSDLKVASINGMRIIGPRKDGGPKMLYIIDETFSINIIESYVAIRFSEDNAISIGDMDGDGYFEQLENVVKNDDGDLLEMLDRNRDGVTDILFKNGDKVSTYQ